MICLGFTSNTHSQTISSQLYGHAWQQKPISNILWNFQENGEFIAMYILVDKESKKISLSGFILKKGTYTVNDSTRILRVSFDSTYSVYSNDSVSVKKDTTSQEWHLITLTYNKIVLNRPPVWEFEKKSGRNEDQRIIVTMEGGKKRRGKKPSRK